MSADIRWRAVMDRATCQACEAGNGAAVTPRTGTPPNPLCSSRLGCRCVMEEQSNGETDRARLARSRRETLQAAQDRVDAANRDLAAGRCNLCGAPITPDNSGGAPRNAQVLACSGCVRGGGG